MDKRTDMTKLTILRKRLKIETQKVLILTLALYAYENWSLALEGKKHRLTLFMKDC
jgi:hypothetical protein